MKRYYLFIIILISIYGCKQNENQNAKTKTEPKEISKTTIDTTQKKRAKQKKEPKNYDFSSIKKDTLYVSGKQIVFAKPSKLELEILKDNQKILKLNSLFELNTTKVINSLKDEFKFITTDKSVIGIIKPKDTVYIDRIASHPVHHYAILVFNDYHLKYSGVHSEEKYMERINEFYDNIRYEKVLENKYVVSRNGLNIRLKGGGVDGKFNNGDKVSVISYNDKVVEIEDKGEIVKGRWAVIKWDDVRTVKKRYVFGGYLGDLEDVVIYEDQLCTGFSLEPNNFQDGSNLECLADYLEFKLISKKEYDAVESINSDFITKNPAVIIEKNDDETKNLTLPLKDSVLTFESKVEYSRSWHDYIGDIDFMNKYLVRNTWYAAEEISYTFIDRTTGKTTHRFTGFPYISPDKKRIVVFFEDIYDEKFYLLEYKLNSDGTTEMVHNFNFIHWVEAHKDEVKWISDNELIVPIVNSAIRHQRRKAKPQYLSLKFKN